MGWLGAGWCKKTKEAEWKIASGQGMGWKAQYITASICVKIE